MGLRRASKNQLRTFGVTLTVLACLFPPLQFLGFRTWGFIFGNAGLGMVNLQFLDPGMLVFELVVIWGIVGGIYYLDQAILPNSKPLRTHAPGTFCSQCGSKNDAGDQFCSECGSRVGGLEDG